MSGKQEGDKWKKQLWDSDLEKKLIYLPNWPEITLTLNSSVLGCRTKDPRHLIWKITEPELTWLSYVSIAVLSQTQKALYLLLGSPTSNISVIKSEGNLPLWMRPMLYKQTPSQNTFWILMHRGRQREVFFQHTSLYSLQNTQTEEQTQSMLQLKMDPEVFYMWVHILPLNVHMHYACMYIYILLWIQWTQ